MNETPSEINWGLACRNLDRSSSNIEFNSLRCFVYSLFIAGALCFSSTLVFRMKDFKNNYI